MFQRSWWLGLAAIPTVGMVALAVLSRASGSRGRSDRESHSVSIVADSEHATRQEPPSPPRPRSPTPELTPVTASRLPHTDPTARPVAELPPAPLRDQLSPRELLEKAGEKDGDTTYARLVDEAVDLVSGLTDAQRRDLRAVGRKRQTRLKLLSRDQPAHGGAPVVATDDEWSVFERNLLGPERYRDYQQTLAELMRR